jgi:hypothetical protein
VNHCISRIALASLILGGAGPLLCTTSIFKWIGLLDTREPSIQLVVVRY